MDIGSKGGSETQFAQKISSVFDSINEQGLKAKEIELEISTGSTSDASQAIQKIAPVVDPINEQGFEVKELEWIQKKKNRSFATDISIQRTLQGFNRRNSSSTRQSVPFIIQSSVILPFGKY